MMPPAVSKCIPEFADSFCKNCKRWARHPSQIFDEQVSIIVSIESSLSEGCMYQPIKPLEHLMRD
jgi:hypothetical protein